MGVFSLPPRIAEFREALTAGVLTADGAMGTTLLSMLGGRAALYSRCLDELNLSLPAMVRDVHQQFLRAGAQIVGTNTFGANRTRLGQVGFGEKTRAINQAGVRIAREAARAIAVEQHAPDAPAFVAGVVGPLGVRLQPLGLTTPAEARVIFHEQIDALVESGADLLLLETFQDLKELREAILAAREAAGNAMVVVAQVSVEEDGSLACGASLREYSLALEGSPVDVIGLNCSFGPRLILETVEKMAAWTSKPLSVMPSAGLPGRVCAPEYLAGMTPDFLRAGVRLMGGCCGTTAEHIRQIRAVLDASGSVVERAAPVVEETVEVESQALQAMPAGERSGLGSRLASRQFVRMVEMLPPRGPDAAREIAAAIECKRAGIETVAIPAGARAAAACRLIQQGAGVESVLGIRRGDPLFVQSELLSAHALGIRNVIFAGNGSAVIAWNLNRGLDPGGHPLGSQTSFLIGVMLNPWSPELGESLDTLVHNADFVMLEPVFDLDFLEEFLARLEPYQLPVIASVRRLTSLRDAEFVMQERGTPVPAAYLDRLRAASNAEAEGLAIAGELVMRLRSMAAGVYLRLDFGASEVAMELMKAIGSPAMNVQPALH